MGFFLDSKQNKSKDNIFQNKFWFVIFFFVSRQFFSIFHYGIRWIVMRNVDISYETSPRGNPILVLQSVRYVRNRESKKRVFWRCTRYYQNRVNCPGSVAITKPDKSGTLTINVTRAHNDLCDMKREQDELRANSCSHRRCSTKSTSTT